MTEPDHVRTTRAAYDATADVYASFVGTEITAAIEAPLDRALLAAFAELVTPTEGRPVGDLGCGTGRVAAYLAGRGLEAIGVDLSPGMLAVARRAHHGIPFREGALTDLPVADGALAGAVCWYSIIHTPPDGLDAIAAELRRVLAADGHLLVAFQAGRGEGQRRDEIQGRPVDLTRWLHRPDDVARALSSAGLRVEAQATRAAAASHESTPQTFLFARA